LPLEAPLDEPTPLLDDVPAPLLEVVPAPDDVSDAAGPRSPRTSVSVAPPQAMKIAAPMVPVATKANQEVLIETAPPIHIVA
jgi:hypothetical protein